MSNYPDPLGPTKPGSPRASESDDSRQAGPGNQDLRDVFSGSPPQDSPRTEPPRWESFPEGSTGEEAELLQALHNGTNWFYWIAGLSFINTVLYSLGANISFRLGLGITLLVDDIAHDPAPQHADVVAAFKIIAMIVDPVCIGLTALWGLLGRNGQNWAILVGGLCIILDTLVLVWIVAMGGVAVILSIVVHCLAIRAIFGAMTASRRLEDLERARAVGR